MPKMKPCFSASMRINIVRCDAAHLASESIPVQDFCAKLARYSALKDNRAFLRRLLNEPVLTRLQFYSVVMGKYFPAFLFAQLAKPAAVLNCASGSRLQFS